MSYNTIISDPANFLINLFTLSTNNSIYDCRLTLSVKAFCQIFGSIMSVVTMATQSLACYFLAIKYMRAGPPPPPNTPLHHLDPRMKSRNIRRFSLKKTNVLVCNIYTFCFFFFYNRLGVQKICVIYLLDYKLRDTILQ